MLYLCLMGWSRKYNNIKKDGRKTVHFAYVIVGADAYIRPWDDVGIVPTKFYTLNRKLTMSPSCMT